MQNEWTKLKSRLTRAKNSNDPHKVIKEVNAALARFADIGYPDQWHDWQRAKDDAEHALRMGRTTMKIG